MTIDSNLLFNVKTTIGGLVLIRNTKVNGDIRIAGTFEGANGGLSIDASHLDVKGLVHVDLTSDGTVYLNGSDIGTDLFISRVELSKPADL